MKTNVTCSVINDLLPLYLDGAASEDSSQLVQEHLAECENCRKIAEIIKKPLAVPKENDSKNIIKVKQLIGIKQLRIATAAALVMIAAIVSVGIIVCMRIYTLGGGMANVQTFMFASVDAMVLLTVMLAWGFAFHYYSHIRFSDDIANNTKKFRRTIIRSFAAMISVFAVLSAGYVLFFYGTRANSDNIDIRTEFQYSEDSYLNQSWVFHLSTKDGKPINTFSLNTYDAENDAWNVDIYVREIPIKGIFNTGKYTGGYSFAGGDDVPSEDFNYTVSIILKDKIQVYDMRKEGLFKKQDNVLYKPETAAKAHHSSQDMEARTANSSELTYIYD